MKFQIGDGFKFSDGSIGKIIHITGSKTLPYYKVKFIDQLNVNKKNSEYLFESDFEDAIKLTKGELVAMML